MKPTRRPSAGSDDHQVPALTGRDDLQHLLRGLCAPVLSRLSPGGARVRLDGAAASYGRTAQEMEGFSRVLWGIAPLLAGGGALHGLHRLQEGLVNGTDPSHPEYWGEPRDRDQRLVEYAALAAAIMIAPQAFWSPLSTVERRRVAAFLGAINRCTLRDNNWLFFRVLVNAALARRGMAHDAAALRGDLRRIDAFYLGRGWYGDGAAGAVDYYAAWAMHFYGLLFARYAGGVHEGHAQRFRARARAFAGEFIHWFADDGGALPYGRSLTYRCAQAAFWAALPVGGDDMADWSVVKGILLRHLRWWLRQPIASEAGLLTPGYVYANNAVGEAYNSPSSPYWALNAFVVLALSADHPFWTAPERALPALPSIVPQRHARMLLGRHGGHVFAFAAPRAVPLQHRHASEKYAKFCYSTLCGFGVPAAGTAVGSSGRDSTLVLASKDGDARVRGRSRLRRLSRAVLAASWSPWPDVRVDTWLIPLLPWHVRVHRVRSARALTAVEGGFAVGIDPDAGLIDRAAQAHAGHAEVASAGLVSGIAALSRRRLGTVLVEEPNTNVCHPHSAVPALSSRHRPGEFWLACAVLVTPTQARSGLWAMLPRFEKRAGGFRVMAADGSVAFDYTSAHPVARGKNNVR